MNKWGCELEEETLKLFEEVKGMIDVKRTPEELAQRYELLAEMMWTMGYQGSVEDLKKEWARDGFTKEAFIEECMNRNKGPAPAPEDRAALMREDRKKGPSEDLEIGRPKPSKQEYHIEDLEEHEPRDGFEHEPKPTRRK